jgi:iron complex outermembrane receptor protein
MTNESFALRRSRRSWRRALACGAAVVALVDFMGTAAFAAEPDETTATDVGEVIVTATKRNERVRDVAASVAVTSGEQLDAVGPVTNTADLVSAVPGARFNNLANPLLSEVSIRGSGTQRATGADSSVGLYANGVFVGFSGTGGRNFAPIDSFDVERVEVLSGPQGALYGRNAEFGVVNLISTRPRFETSGEAESTYTFETNQWIGKAILNYQVNDNVAIRLSAQDTEQNKGFVYNPTQDRYYDHTSGYLLRGQVRYRTDKLDITFLAQRQDLRLPSFWSAFTFLPADPTTGFPGNANYPKGFFQDPRNIPSDGRVEANQEVDNLNLSVEYDLGWAQLVSTSSFRKTYIEQFADPDILDVPTLIALQQQGNRGAWPFSQNENRGETKSYYQDIHLTGAPVMNDRLTWLVGLELLRQPQSSNQTGNQNPCATDRAPNLVIGQGVCGGTPTAPTCTPLLGPTCPAAVSPYGSVRTNSGVYRSWAPYVSLKFKLGGGFAIGGDLRYTKDRKTADSQTRVLYTGAPYPFLSGGVIPDTDYKLTDSNWTYTATISYTIPGSSNLIYAKTGTGYRVGGFNFATSPPLINPPFPTGITAATNYAPITKTYDSERNKAYEVGFKGDVAPRTYVTLAAYWQKTTDALAAVTDGCMVTNACLAGPTNYVVNAGTVHGYGIEGQFNTAFDLAGGLVTFQSSVSNQVAKYHSIPTAGPNGERLNGLPVVDTQIAQNPQWLVDATLNYKRPITEHLKGFFNLRYHGQWGGIQDPQVSAVGAFRMDDYESIDIRTGVQFRAVEVALIVRNLTDETHRLAQFQANGTNTITRQLVAVQSQQRLSLPRSVAVEVGYRW